MTVETRDAVGESTTTGAGPSRVGPNRGDAIAFALLVVAFAPALANMAAVWNERDYYTHGYLVPLVSLWAGAGLWRRVTRRARRPDGRAVLVLAGIGALYVLGLGAAWVPLQGSAFVAAVAALIWARCGLAWLRALAFPVAFLLFMVPVPDAWLSPAIVTLQLAVSQVGVTLLRAAGFSVYRDGNVLELPGGDSLFVAEACSGITSLLTLLPLAVVLAYFTQRTLLRRLLLVLAVLPLAMLGNLIRVVGTVLAAERWGSEAATQGSLHEAAGVLTYVLGCLALLAVGALLERWVPDSKPTVQP